MKKVMITAAMMLALYTANAQTAANGKREEKSAKVKSAGDDEYAGTSIALRKRKIIFSDLPQATQVLITDSNGELVKDARVSPADFAVDIHNLDKGIYFIKLMYNGENRKGFVLNL